MGRVQVLEQVARHQLVAQRGLVEEGFPLRDLPGLVRAGCPGLFVDDGALKYPLPQGLVFSLTESGNGQRHALLWFLFRVLVEFVDCRTFVFARQPQLDILGYRGIGRQGVRATQFNHPEQHGVRQVVVERAAPVVQHGEKTFLAPLGLALGVDKQTGRIRFAEPGAIVYRLDGGAAQQPFT